jgi:enediyne biosynthesis protein E4
LLAARRDFLRQDRDGRRGNALLDDQQKSVNGAWTRAAGSLAALGSLLAGCARPPSSLPPPRFRDVTCRVPASGVAPAGGGASGYGLDFVHENGASGRKYFVETMGAGVAFLDFDNDGWLDILCVNGTPLPGCRPRHTPPALFRSVRGRRFENVTAAAGLDVSFFGMGCAVGDYDNDGWEDIYFSAVLGPGHLYHNTGGRFEDVTGRAGVGNAGKWGTSCAWLDYDRDGRLDLYVANYVRYASLRDDLPCIVRPGRRSYCIPQGYEGSSGVLYRNEGGGRFRDVTRQVGLEDPTMKALGVAVGDLDADGWPDLFVANDTVPNRLYQNRRGVFHDIAGEAGIAVSETGVPRAGMGIDVAVWQDGTLGVAITHFARESIGLFTQDAPGAGDTASDSQSRPPAPGAFHDVAGPAGLAAPSQPYLGFGILFLDYDNDGDSDLAAVNGHVRDDVAELSAGQSYRQPALLFRNEGTPGDRSGARFRDVSAAAGVPITEPRVGRGLAVGDVDNDGRVDLLVSENHGPVRLWLNETTGVGHWLIVRLEGTRSNRDGLGARITVTAGGREQTAWARSGSSYLSASDRRVHFGLGSARRVDRLTVLWPSGSIQERRDVPADQVLSLREEEGRRP